MDAEEPQVLEADGRRLRNRRHERVVNSPLDLAALSAKSRARFGITVCVLMTLSLLVFLTTFVSTADNNKAFLQKIIDRLLLSSPPTNNTDDSM
jgi:hypothetical protein